VLGIKVKIMLPWDPAGKDGPKRPLPDNVVIVEPKEEPVTEGSFYASKLAGTGDAGMVKHEVEA
jgi:small subunit ribosomal protein S3e